MSSLSSNTQYHEQFLLWVLLQGLPHLCQTGIHRGCIAQRLTTEPDFPFPSTSLSDICRYLLGARQVDGETTNGHSRLLCLQR
jgi:hypothetical protein